MKQIHKQLAFPTWVIISNAEMPSDFFQALSYNGLELFVFFQCNVFSECSGVLCLHIDTANDDVVALQAFKRT